MKMTKQSKKEMQNHMSVGKLKFFSRKYAIFITIVCFGVDGNYKTHNELVFHVLN